MRLGAVETALARTAKTLVIVGAVISMLGHACATSLARARALFAFVGERFPPSVLGRVHPVRRSRVAAMLVQCAIVLALAITSTFQRLAILANLDPHLLHHPWSRGLGINDRATVRAEAQRSGSPSPGDVIALPGLFVGTMLTGVTAAEGACVAHTFPAAVSSFDESTDDGVPPVSRTTCPASF